MGDEREVNNGANNYVQLVALNGTALEWTGIGDAFGGSVDLAPILGNKYVTFNDGGSGTTTASELNDEITIQPVASSGVTVSVSTDLIEIGFDPTGVIGFNVTDGNVTTPIPNGATVTLGDTASVNLILSGSTITAQALPGGIDHNLLLNYVSNEHIDHSDVDIIAGVALIGGGDLTESRTINLEIDSVADGTPMLTDRFIFRSDSGHFKATLTELQSLIDTDTTYTFSPTDAINLSEDALTVTATLLLDTVTNGGDNIAVITPGEGLYVPPSAGGASYTFEGSDGVTLVEDSNLVTATIVIDTVTNGGNNILVKGPNGLYVPPSAAGGGCGGSVVNIDMIADVNFTVTDPDNELLVQQEILNYMNVVNTDTGEGSTFFIDQTITVHDYTATGPAPTNIFVQIVIGGTPFNFASQANNAALQAAIETELTNAGATFDSVTVNDFASQNTLVDTIVITGCSLVCNSIGDGVSNISFVQSNPQSSGSIITWYVAHGCTPIRVSNDAYLLDKNFAEQNLTANDNRLHTFNGNNLTINFTSGDTTYSSESGDFNYATQTGHWNYNRTEAGITRTEFKSVAAGSLFGVQAEYEVLNVGTDPIGGYGIVRSTVDTTHEIMVYLTATDTQNGVLSGIAIGSGGGDPTDGGVLLFANVNGATTGGSSQSGTTAPLGHLIQSDDVTLWPAQDINLLGGGDINTVYGGGFRIDNSVPYLLGVTAAGLVQEFELTGILRPASGNNYVLNFNVEAGGVHVIGNGTTSDLTATLPDADNLDLGTKAQIFNRDFEQKATIAFSGSDALAYGVDQAIPESVVTMIAVGSNAWAGYRHYPTQPFQFGEAFNQNQTTLADGDMLIPFTGDWNSNTTWAFTVSNASSYGSYTQVVASRFPTVLRRGALKAVITVTSAVTISSDSLELKLFKADASEFGGALANVTFNQVAVQSVGSINTTFRSRTYTLDGGIVDSGDRVIFGISSVDGDDFSSGQVVFKVQLFVD